MRIKDTMFRTIAAALTTLATGAQAETMLEAGMIPAREVAAANCVMVVANESGIPGIVDSVKIDGSIHVHSIFKDGTKIGTVFSGDGYSRYSSAFSSDPSLTGVQSAVIERIANNCSQRVTASDWTPDATLTIPVYPVTPVKVAPAANSRALSR